MFSRPVNSSWKPVPTSSSEAMRPRALRLPVVGAVILAPNGAWLAEGAHFGAGTAHAEVNALSQAFAIAIPHEQAMDAKDEVGFFQAVKNPALHS